MPSAQILRTGKTLIDVSGNEDSSQSVVITGSRSFWIAGLTSNGNSDDYAVVELGDNGQLDFDYSQDGVDRLPQVGNLDEGSGLAGERYGDILVSSIVETASGYTLHLQPVRSLPPGRPDEFGAVAIPAQTPAPTHSSVQIEADSTVLASARSESTLSVAHFTSSGALDLSVSDSGVVTFALPQGLGFDSETPLALQADGRWVVAGHSEQGSDEGFTVVRFNSDGTLDATFGTAGTATFDIGAGDDLARAVAIQADGKLLIAGTSETQDGGADFSVIRLTADGTLDATFGSGGKATFDFAGGRDAAQTVTVLDDGKILLTGSADNAAGNADIAALQLNADGTLDTSFGDPADGLHHITGRGAANLLVGTNDDDLISGLGGSDLLDGGAGRDRLRGGDGADTFRVTERSDSYRSASANFSDTVVDFDPAQDVLDVSALGFSGLGDGYDGTLAAQVNASGTRTYLKSFEADANGHRFELALEGDLGGQLTASNVAFVAPTIEGDDSVQRIQAFSLGSELLGGGGNDRVLGGLGNDTLEGNAGRDVLLGLTGADTFRYTALTDSYRDASQSASDRILDFEVIADRIDVSALGFTGLGDGRNGTLAISTSEATGDTYLTSLDANAAGQRFQVTLAGDLSQLLTDDLFVFAPGQGTDLQLVGATEPAA